MNLDFHCIKEEMKIGLENGDDKTELGVWRRWGMRRVSLSLCSAPIPTLMIGRQWSAYFMLLQLILGALGFPMAGTRITQNVHQLHRFTMRTHCPEGDGSIASERKVSVCDLAFSPSYL